MPMKKSLVFTKLRRGDCGSIGAVMRGSTWIAGGDVGIALTSGAVVGCKTLVKHELTVVRASRRQYQEDQRIVFPGKWVVQYRKG